LLSFFFSNSGFCSKDETVIERINASESIEVHIVLGDVTSENYNADMGQVPLTSGEASVSRIAAKMPAEMDTLMPFLVKTLNTQFKTTKFTAGLTDSRENITKYILANGKQLSAISELKASYNYIYTNFKTRRVQHGNTTRLVSKRKIVGVGDIGFYTPNTEDKELNNLVKVTGLCYGTTAVLQDYVHNANTLMKIISPLKLVGPLKALLTKRIEKLYQKEEKKYQKAMKKK
ncbi:MAG: hypothetical protein AB8B72_11285, partial [Crocinitomicaceae bacterium]